ncbi:MAG: hypothetical protein JWL95_321 [Gemmatimonadetes bacterium]|nr:hypothetical protein [Gemmatimonadota bacterium]
MLLQPLAPSAERTLPQFRPTRVAQPARHALFALSLLLSLTSCRDTLAGFGAGPRARANADQFFGTLAQRYTDVQLDPKFEYARVQISRNALVPSRVFQDSAVWTGSSGPVRLLETHGAFMDGRYLLASRSGVPAPHTLADGRHVTTLSMLSGSEYRWDTTVDFAVGAVRPSEVAAVLARLIASAERSTDRTARADLLDAAPRTSAVLGSAFSLDSLHPTQLADGTTAVTLVIALRSDLLKRRYPEFADYLRRYLEPARYGFVVTDRAGVIYADGSAKDRLLTLHVRTLRGQMVALSGAARAMPDTLAMLADFKTKIKHFSVGFHALPLELFHLRRGDADNEWVVRARREPEWDFPLAAARLIRSSLRRPFSGEGSLFRVGLRADASAPTVLVRQSRLFVQESAILRFLNSLGSAAMDDFATKVEREENAWLRELFLAMRDDARVAIGP